MEIGTRLCARQLNLISATRRRYETNVAKPAEASTQADQVSLFLSLQSTQKYSYLFLLPKVESWVFVGVNCSQYVENAFENRLSESDAIQILNG